MPFDEVDTKGKDGNKRKDNKEEINEELFINNIEKILKSSLTSKENKNLISRSKTMKSTSEIAEVENDNKDVLKLSCKEKCLISIDLFDCFKKCCFKKNEKLELYLKGSDSIENYFEMTNIIDRLNEVNKLKKVLLTPEQLLLFKINLGDELSIISNSTESQKKENEENTQKCIEYIKKLKSGKFESEIDERLYNLINKQ